MKTDARVKYTRMVLKKALLELMQHKPINKITVKAKEAIDDLMFTFTGDNFINLVVISLLTTCEQLVNGIIVPFDPVFVEISYKYNEVLRK